MINYEEVFNKIEKVASTNGYFVNRFTRGFPTYTQLDISITEPVHYIHVVDGEEILLRVFYDEKCHVNLFFGGPNYDICYEGGNIRFPETEDSIEKLLKYANRVCTKSKLNSLD